MGATFKKINEEKIKLTKQKENEIAKTVSIKSPVGCIPIDFIIIIIIIINNNLLACLFVYI